MACSKAKLKSGIMHLIQCAVKQRTVMQCTANQRDIDLTMLPTAQAYFGEVHLSNSCAAQWLSALAKLSLNRLMHYCVDPEHDSEL
jgi:hypothetical protein